MVDNKKVENIFFSDYVKRIAELKANNTCLAHYTSVSTALKFLKNKTLWLGNVSYMNDYREITQGRELLARAYNTSEIGIKFQKLINSMHPGATEKIKDLYNPNNWAFYNTYALCLSEHKGEDSPYGRLSMWRAYAPQDGVALVFKNTPFVTETTKTQARTIPIFYFEYGEFLEKFANFTRILETNKEWIKNLPVDTFIQLLFTKFYYTAISIKHVGFKEEREWRIMYNENIRLIVKSN